MKGKHILWGLYLIVMGTSFLMADFDKFENSPGAIVFAIGSFITVVLIFIVVIFFLGAHYNDKLF